MICISPGVWANKVVVPEQVTAVLGKNVTLTCRVEVSTDLSLTQSSWERRLPSGTVTLAVFNPEYGTSIAEEYSRRVHFLKPSMHDVSIVLEGMSFADIGTYTCKVVTFQLGNMQASTTVDIMVHYNDRNCLRNSGFGDSRGLQPRTGMFWIWIYGLRPPTTCAIRSAGSLFLLSGGLGVNELPRCPLEPKVYVSPGSLSLLAGEDETLVATCTAERGRPAAEVFWESDLPGQTSVVSREEPEGTTTTLVHYILAPTRDAFGRSLSCIVRHPALSKDFRIPYKLNVFFAPDITVMGQEDVWLDAPMPAGVDTSNGSLLFTRPLKSSDSGQYRCEVRNDVGQSFQDVRFLVLASINQRAHFTSPTQASPPDSSLGTIVGGAVGGILILVLLMALAGAFYMRQRRTFRGDYYTKQYIGPSDMQKESQLDVLQPHELHDVYGGDSGNGSQDLKPKPEGDIIYPDYPNDHKDMEAWSDNLSLKREDTYYSDHHNHHNVNPSGPPLHNGSPYLQDECYDNGTDSDYVSHVDGSVISRREWYV
ncbi:hypothetical protein PO909_003368 [Leuciscus waleckii]